MTVEPAQRNARPGGAKQFEFVDPTELEHWDDLISALPDRTIFHTRGWAQVLHATYQYRACYVLASKGSAPAGVLPLFDVRSWLTGHRGVSLPFTDACTPLVSGETTVGDLFTTACELGAKQGWKSLQLRGISPEFAPASSTFHHHELDLNVSEADLFNGCDSAMRRAIRKAEKANIRIQVDTSLESVESYYRLHQLTRQKHGVPPQSFAFFKNLWEYVLRKGAGVVLRAFVDQRPIAGTVFLRAGQHSVYKFGASDPAYQELRPNNLLLWQGILEMKRFGAQKLSFGRSSIDQEGLARFKRSFGAAETPLYYATYLYKTGDWARQTPDSGSGRFSRMFRFCPRPVARMIGTLLYPHVG